MQVILALVSLALGGVVFAVTADFVIGVAVGAGFFALAVRGMQAWSRKAPQPDSPPQLEREPSTDHVAAAATGRRPPS